MLPRRPPSHLLAGLVVLSVVSALRAVAVGCGEPFQSTTDSCSDPQCSRPLLGETGIYCVRGLPTNANCSATRDCYMEHECRGGLCAKTDDTQVAWQGWAAIAVAVVALGSNFIPARRIEPGNGLFFQFFMSVGILMAGFAVQMVRGAPYFYPYAMLGGMLWCLGNTLGLPALKLISMGLAVSIWGSTNMIVGWASGKFGIWGIDKEKSEVDWIGYVGVAFGVCGCITLAFVKKNASPHRAGRTDEDLLANMDQAVTVTGYGLPTDPYQRVNFHASKEDYLSRLSRTQQRIIGVCLALVAGCLFGLNFNPPTLLLDEYSERSLTEDVKYSPNGLDYVFSHFFGIFCTASCLMLGLHGIDSLVTLPEVFTADSFEKLVLPGFLSGVGWSIGQISWFVANMNLGLVVSFPIIMLSASMVANLWSIFLFGEIRGRQNYLLLSGAFVFLGAAATCTVLSRNGF